MLETCPPWVDEPATDEWRQLAVNVEQRACEQARAGRIGHRHVGRWHRALFEKLVPRRCYAGGYRQPAAPGVDRCLDQEVGVGGYAGFPSVAVLPATIELFGRVDRELTELDREWDDLNELTRLRRTAETVGNAVGTFIRIHPFINGNGRTSRLLWRVFLQRLGLPASLGIEPRPGAPYGPVMRAAMVGDYSGVILLVLQGIAAASPPGASP